MSATKLYRFVKASDVKPKEGWHIGKCGDDECAIDVNNGEIIVTFPNGKSITNGYVSMIEYLVPIAPLPPQPVPEEVEKVFRRCCLPNNESVMLPEHYVTVKLEDVYKAMNEFRLAGASSVNVDVLVRALEKINSMAEDTGREGCTWGDTDYNSLSAVAGYNQALQYTKEIASSALAAHQSSGEMGEDQEALVRKQMNSD